MNRLCKSARSNETRGIMFEELWQILCLADSVNLSAGANSAESMLDFHLPPDSAFCQSVKVAAHSVCPCFCIVKHLQKVRTLRKKYDDLVAFTVNLTAEKARMYST